MSEEILDITFAVVSYIYRCWTMTKKERRAYERVMRHIVEGHPESVGETTLSESIAQIRQLFSHPATHLGFGPVGEGKCIPEDGGGANSGIAAS